MRQHKQKKFVLKRLNTNLNFSFVLHETTQTEEICGEETKYKFKFIFFYMRQHKQKKFVVKRLNTNLNLSFVLHETTQTEEICDEETKYKFKFIFCFT